MSGVLEQSQCLCTVVDEMRGEYSGVAFTHSVKTSEPFASELDHHLVVEVCA